MRGRHRWLGALVAATTILGSALGLVAAPAHATDAPTISGVPAVGEVLTAHTATEPFGGSYAWLSDGLPIAEATAQQYTLTAADLGHEVSVRVADASGEATSEPVTIGEGAAPVNLEAPVITGTGRPGEAIQVSDGTWNRPGLTFSYQWLRDGQPVPDATLPTYTIGQADVTHDLRAVVTAHQDGYATADAVSDTRTIRDWVIDCWPVHVDMNLVDDVVTPREHAVIKVRIRSIDGRAPSRGSVTLRVDRRTLPTVRLHRRDRGRVWFRLPRLEAGRHQVRASFDAPANSGVLDGDDTMSFRVRRHA